MDKILNQIEPGKYRGIIFAGGIYASGISGLNILRRHYKAVQDMKILVFCVGASPFEEKAFEEIKARNLRQELKDIPLFYGRGCWDESKMDLKDRTLCRLLHRAVAKQDPAALEPWAAALMNAFGQKCDWTDKAYLKPVFEYIREEWKVPTV